MIRRAWMGAIALMVTAFPVTGLCSNILGVVNDSQGNPVNGCAVNVTDSTGKLVGDAKTDLYGRYCIPAVEPRDVYGCAQSGPNRRSSRNRRGQAGT